MTDWSGLSTLLTIIIGVTGSAASVASLGWWLSARFRAVENACREMLEEHEQKDQERHEENLKRFAQISVALARLGYRNVMP